MFHDSGKKCRICIGCHSIATYFIKNVRPDEAEIKRTRAECSQCSEEDKENVYTATVLPQNMRHGSCEEEKKMTRPRVLPKQKQRWEVRNGKIKSNATTLPQNVDEMKFLFSENVSI